MRHPIGFTTGFFYKVGRDAPLLEKLSRLHAASHEVLELHLTDLTAEGWTPSKVEGDLIRSFGYRSIHLPGHMKFPSEELSSHLKNLELILDEVRPSTLVLHPDLIADADWVDSTFDDRIALENMDWRRDSGNTVESLNKFFKRFPRAGWVFDVNHVYTLDPSMQLGKKLYDAFSDKIRYYHVSGFGDKETIHTCLAETHEDEIIRAVMDDGKPIVLESIGTSSITDPRVELTYVTKVLGQ